MYRYKRKCEKRKKNQKKPRSAKNQNRENKPMRVHKVIAGNSRNRSNISVNIYDLTDLAFLFFGEPRLVKAKN